MLLCQMSSTEPGKKVGMSETQGAETLYIPTNRCKKTTLLSWVMAFQKKGEVLLQICPNFRISMLARRRRKTLKERHSKNCNRCWLMRERKLSLSRKLATQTLGAASWITQLLPPHHAEFRSTDFWLWLWYMDGLHSCHPNTHSA